MNGQRDQSDPGYFGCKSNQNTQNNQVDRLLELGCNALCVNIVDRFAASVVIDKAMAADVPVIFLTGNQWKRI